MARRNRGHSTLVRVNRRIVTIVAALVPIVVLCVIGSTVRVPFVALGPGPTFNTLGNVDVDGKSTPVVDIRGTQLDPTAGHLNMTTVSVRDDLTVFEALGLWASGSQGLVPRDEVYAPGKSREQIDKQNTAEFQSSENNAEDAALRYLKYPFVVTVGGVAQNGPAQGKLESGDELVQVNGAPVTTSEQVQAVMKDTKPGEQIPVVYRRKGVEGSASITLAPGPDPKDPKGVMGIVLADRPQVPFTVDFNLANIGGPSAGLMFSLAVVDKLSPGELNGGKFVAGTGTIDPAGQVGPIGGIEYKMRAARDAGATVFLVPADNCSVAKQTAPQGLSLIKVDSLSSAIAGLGDYTTGKPVPQC